MSATGSLFLSLSNSLWNLNQDIAHDEYLGHERDNSQLARDIGAVALALMQVCDELSEPETKE